MEEKPIGYGTVYGAGSPRDILRPVEQSRREADERAARRKRQAEPLNDPALLGFDPYPEP